jgi:hypothetical protein
MRFPSSTFYHHENVYGLSTFFSSFGLTILFVLVCRMVGYFQSKGIQPLPAIVAKEEDIVVEDEEEEIDLSLDFDGEGDIVVSGGGNSFSDAFD